MTHAPGSVLEISVRWQDQLVEVVRSTSGHLSVGTDAECDLYLPSDVLGGPRFDLVTQLEPGRAPIVRATSAMHPRVWRDRSVLALPPFHAQEVVGLPVEPGVVVALSFGPFEVRIQQQARSPRAVLASMPDLSLINTAILTLFTMVTLVSALLLAPAPLEEEGDLLLVEPSFVAMVTQPRSRPTRETEPQPVTREPSRAAAIPTSTLRATRRSRRAGQALQAGRLSNVLAALDNGGALSGALQGTLIGELRTAIVDVRTLNPGEGGLRTRGGPRATQGGELLIQDDGGRLDKLINAAATEGTAPILKHDDRPIVVHADTPVIVGSLDKELIRRVVRQHAGQIRHCYERALNVTPGLEGRMVVGWQIQPSGLVRSAHRKRSTLNHPEVEDCITSKVGRWRFPKPEGGSSVLVSYPFTFRRSG